MGAHKYNKTAQQAKAWLIPPKPRPMSKRQREGMMLARFYEMLYPDLYPYQHQLLKSYIERREALKEFETFSSIAFPGRRGR